MRPTTAHTCAPGTQKLLTSTFSLQPPKACERREEPWESCSPRRGHGDSRDHSSRRPAGRPYDYHYCCFFLLLGSKKWACINYPAAPRKPAITRVRREKYGPGRGCHGIYNFLRIWHRKSPRRHVARHGGAEQNGKQSRQQRDRTSRYRQGSRPRVRTAAAGCPAPAGLHGEGAADPARPLPCELTHVGGTSPCGSASPRAR